MLGHYPSGTLKKLISKVLTAKTNDDSKLLLRLNHQLYLPEEIFCSVLLYLPIKESDYVLFEFGWGVLGEGVWFIHGLFACLVNLWAKQVKQFGRKNI